MKIKNFRIKWYHIFITVFVLFFLIHVFNLESRTFKAYNIISSNYESFNYPNTIKIHSGTLNENDIKNIFTCKISAENAFGKRGYDIYIVSEDGLYAANDLFQSVIGEDAPSSTISEANRSNVDIALLNFFIGLDW